MLNIAIRKKIIITLFIFLLGFSFISIVPISAQTYTHKVVKGDTLWSICIQYYGDAMLWPKLWQMNPFITNPHLLEAGDMINLLEDVPFKTALTPVPTPQTVSGTTPEVVAEPVPVIPVPVQPIITAKGIDVSGYTDVQTLGYFSPTKIKPWGRIHSINTSKILPVEGDVIYVQFYQTANLKPGDEFVAYQVSPILRHPLTKKKIGQVVEILGKIRMVKPTQNNFYIMQVVKLYRTVNINDFIIPIEPVSPCVLPVSAVEMDGHIIATKDLKQIISNESIVYIDHGFNHGVQRGNIFDVVQTVTTWDNNLKTRTATTPGQNAIIDELSVGKMLILMVRPDSSVGLIFNVGHEELSDGAFIRSLSWTKPPKFLEKLPSCSIR